MQKKWLRVSKIPNDGSFPIARATAFKWHHLKRYPQLFSKFGGALFIDVDELERIMEEARGK